ncbi:hypothetical protein KDK95_25125 [Actinospica sp. MGRD01-02]|uniref:MerR family transcriptional regulator n=1 Tax=Actinospica acidithermotolerans TaxID=2828514 RepID=A0A941EF75_9ACTN|nr:chaperone modulator CbpM [Actinospica acidithermotolerans]MBR7829613.1 hypothetical protein [Actinospica acidithermotolerans]
MNHLPSTPRRVATRVSVSARYPLVAAPRPARDLLSLDEVATRCGVHAQLISRLVTLSVVDARRDAQGRLWFDRRAPLLIARAQRLHDDLGLNYAALGLVLDLLDRIDHLEGALRRSGHPG